MFWNHHRHALLTLIAVLAVALAAACGPPVPHGGGGGGGGGDANNDDNDFESVEGESCIHASPHSIDFESIPVGDTATEMVTITNCSADHQLAIEEVFAPTPGSVFSLDLGELDESLPDEPHHLEPEQQVALTLQFSPDSVSQFSNTLQINSDAENAPTLEISVTAEAIDDSCLVAEAGGSVGDESPTTSVVAVVGQQVQLTAEDSVHPDGGELNYHWAIIDSPSGSSAELTPGADVEQPQIEPDLLGAYTVELTLTDDDELTECSPSLVDIEAVDESDGEIHIQLTWESEAVEAAGGPDPDAQIGTDLGLHYARDTDHWGESESVYWAIPDQDWGADGEAVMDIDSIYGDLPENINHSSPAAGGSYHVGVHYYCENGYDHSDATLRVYFDGNLAAEEQRRIDATGDFWHVGDIQWGASPTFDVVDDYTEDFEPLPNCEGV